MSDGWHKWPEEKPSKDGRYLFQFTDGTCQVIEEGVRWNHGAVVAWHALPEPYKPPAPKKCRYCGEPLPSYRIPDFCDRPEACAIKLCGKLDEARKLMRNVAAAYTNSTTMRDEIYAAKLWLEASP